MMKPRFFLLGALFFQFAFEAYAMKCSLPLGMELTCPHLFGDDDNIFCCHSTENIPYCCDIGDYIQNNSAIIAGVIVGAIILLIIITLCCCCFCSCCLLAKRRTHQGTVLYAPVVPEPVVSSISVLPPVYSPSPYPLQSSLMVHTPPPDVSSQYPPPYPQPALNPNFKG